MEVFRHAELADSGVVCGAEPPGLELLEGGSEALQGRLCGREEALLVQRGLVQQPLNLHRSQSLWVAVGAPSTQRVRHNSGAKLSSMQGRRAYLQLQERRLRRGINSVRCCWSRDVLLRCTAGGMLRTFLVIGGLHIVLKDAFGGHGSVCLACTTGLSYCARLCIFALKFMSVLLRLACGVQRCSAAGALGWQHSSPPTLCLQELANNK